ncbi:MAG: hypothetical protein NT062_18365 [Proteobacteria bacterium]|nr:hypothetical protein [Pseudomonadota bacterium]
MSSAGGRSDLRPTEGARFLLERRSAEAGPHADYACVIVTPDAEYPVAATLVDDGDVTLVGDAPEELRATLAMFGKLVARGAAKRREDGLTAWPARVMRWRGPGR